MESKSIEKIKENTRGGGTAPLWDPDTAQQLYCDTDMTITGISDHLGTSNDTVRKWLDRHGVKVKDYDGCHGPNYDQRKPNATYHTTEKGYERWASYSRSKKRPESVAVHRLLAVAEHGFSALDGMHVHHRDHIPWGNRPENLELVTPSEHMSHHKSDSPPVIPGR